MDTFANHNNAIKYLLFLLNTIKFLSRCLSVQAMKILFAANCVADFKKMINNKQPKKGVDSKKNTAATNVFESSLSVNILTIYQQ